MKLTHIFVVALLAAVGGWPACTALAVAEDPADFVQALREGGYADIAADYLSDLKQSKNLPADLAEVWDFEMAKCLRAAAAEAYNASQREWDMAEAQKHLDRFLKEQPDHPEALSAMVWWAGFSTDRAMEHLRASKDVRLSKEKQADERKAAREALLDAGPKFARAADKLQAQLAKARGRKRGETLRENLEAKWQDARFQAVLCDYYLAETYDDAEDSHRAELLEKAAAEFDAIFQANRATVTGLLAHTWQGKVVMELGNADLAKDIFDEVLVIAPEPGELGKPRAAGMEALFTQVQQFDFQILAKKSLSQFVSEAGKWRANYRKLKQTDGYQGISLDLAKTLLEMSDKAKGQEKSKLLDEALKILAEMVQVRSSSQQEAIRLRQERRGRSGEAATLDEATVAGDAAAAAGCWDDAVERYEQALELAEKFPGKKDAKQRVDAARDAAAGARYMIAREQFNQGKLDACLASLQALLEKYPDRAAAPPAAALEVAALLNQYLAVPPENEAAKSAALKRVIAQAEFAARTWPGKPEADDARMTLGQAYLIDGETEKALKEFDAVNPKSERYATALRLTGQTYWERYLRGKQPRGPRDQRSAEEMALDRARAFQAIDASLKLQNQVLPSRHAMPKLLVETQLLLAEMNLEKGDAKAAAALFQPLVETVKAAKPESLDNTMLRIFLGAVRAAAATDDFNEACEVGMTLMALGPDAENINFELLKFAKLVDIERKKAESQLATAVGVAATQAAKARLAAIRNMLEKLLTQLAARQHVTPAGMVWIAETSSAFGLDRAAEAQCQRLLERVTRDKDFRERGGAKAVTRIRTLLIQLQAKQGQYAEALKEVEQLIEDNPRALEPKLEKCRILQAWGERDPAKSTQAIMEWDLLRRAAEHLKRDKVGARPPEYYQIAYDEAFCIYGEAKRLELRGEKAAAADLAEKGQQVLKSILFQSSRLSGPDMVAKYGDLIKQFDVLQGRKPEAAARGE